MVADYFSKPLQGMTFIVFRNIILGIRSEDFDIYKKEYYEILQKYGLSDDAAPSSSAVEDSTKDAIQCYNELSDLGKKVGAEIGTGAAEPDTPQECVGGPAGEHPGAHTHAQAQPWILIKRGHHK